jgi:hypothetical protein
MKAKIMIIAVFASMGGSAFAVQFERVTTCNSLHYQYYKFGKTKELTEACSIAEAAKMGIKVCEDEAFEWLRQQPAMTFKGATIKNTTCVDDPKSYARPNDVTCTTMVTVECE